MDEPDRIWPPPIKRPTQQQPTKFVKWRRHRAPLNVTALRLSVGGAIASVIGIVASVEYVLHPQNRGFITIFGLTVILGWPSMLIGLICGLCTLRSREGKIATVIPLIIIAFYVYIAFVNIAHPDISR